MTNEKQEKRKERFKRTMIWIFAIYLLLLAGFYFFQHLFFFHPKKLPSDYKFSFKQKFVEKIIKPDANTVTDIIRFLPQDSAKGVVLYFHGNRDNIERYAPYADIFTRNSYECWMVDYPSYGKSTGALTAENINLQAMQLYLLARSMFPAKNIIIYGKSLGTGPATYLAATRECNQLVLETPYYSLRSLAMHYAPIFPMGWLLKVNFENGENLKEVKVPVTIFHGTDDRTVPYSNAKKLENVLKANDQFVTIEGGHHNGIATFKLYKTVMNTLLKKAIL